MRTFWRFVLVCSALVLAGAGKPAGKGGGARSKLVVRCPEECTVKVEGREGTRQSSNIWEFTEMKPGNLRVDVTSKVLFVARPLFSGYVKVPAGKEVLAVVDARGRLTI